MGFLGVAGTVLDLVDLVSKLTGGGTGRASTLRTCLAHHGEMLEQLLAGQGEMLEGLEWVSGQVGGVSDQVGEIGELIKQIETFTGEQQAALRQRLGDMMAEQQRLAAQINANIAKVSRQVEGVWSDMNSWFATTLGNADNGRRTWRTSRRSRRGSRLCYRTCWRSCTTGWTGVR
ncbi:hypothetical protein ACIRF8_08755 [Streptomyces sp. NPDC102406]|uniref:hypothetical protein n=1 Tax=Streptomyces sp. NPDC102406 TaxID=3366171 RepID=UPI0037F4A151